MDASAGRRVGGVNAARAGGEGACGCGGAGRDGTVVAAEALTALVALVLVAEVAVVVVEVVVLEPVVVVDGALLLSSVLVGMRDARLAAAAATPCTTKSSDVSVPVLSKQQISILPAVGMRKGSVQKTPSLCSAKREWFTARESSIGSSGGTTEVMIIKQCSTSFHRDRVGSCARLTNFGNGRSLCRVRALASRTYQCTIGEQVSARAITMRSGV
eukprot:5121379-Pleurochrysis_carterae.AAC.1